MATKGSFYKIDFWPFSFIVQLPRLHVISIHAPRGGATVELSYSDGSVLTIDCEEVENFYHVTRWQLTDLDWLVYHAPIEYAGLVLPGRIKSYLNGTTLHGMESE